MSPSLGTSPHGTEPRGLKSTPSSSQQTGRFGRMFRRLPVFETDAKSLGILGLAMIQQLDKDPDGTLVLDKPLGADDDDENTAKLGNDELRLPVGYTYFGQFVDHDITHDPTSSLTSQNDPDALVDFRTPRFDLDSLYGRGPDEDPYAYDGLKLREGLERGPEGRRDLPRAMKPGTTPDMTANDGVDRAIIGDPRNDENLIVSQLQATFIRFHNRVVDSVQAHEPRFQSDTDRFKRAQQLVRWHYQWVVVHDFLRRIVGDDPFDPDTGVVHSILAGEEYETSVGTKRAIRPRLLFYHWRNTPFMPVEFSVAAYRYGHSMVRPSYHINTVLEGVFNAPRPLPGTTGAVVNRIPIFTRTPGSLEHLNGFRPLPDDWGVDWSFFLHLGNADTNLPQPSYKIDTALVNPVGHLPDSVATPEAIVPGLSDNLAVVLAARNLIRGLRLSIPAGEDVARAMGIEPDPTIAITKDTLAPALEFGADVPVTQPDIDVAAADLKGGTPLWYYILKEAELLDGAHLGAVGGRIVAEVLIGLLAGDPLSYLSVQPDWQPMFPRLDGSSHGPYTLRDLVAFATDIVG